MHKSALSVRAGVCRRQLLLAVSGALLCGVSVPALAQATSAPAPPPTADENGVSLTTGAYIISLASLKIGEGDGELDLYRQLSGIGTSGGQLNLWITADSATVDLNGSQHKFTISGSAISSAAHDGTYLEHMASNYVFTDHDGVKYTFAPYLTSYYMIQSEVHPDGKTITYNQSTTTSNYGYQRNYSGSTSNGGQVARLVNLTVDACDSNGSCPTLTRAWPTVTFAQAFTKVGSGGSLTFTATDSIGRQTKAVQQERDLNGSMTFSTVSRPGVATTSTASYDGSSRATSVSAAGVLTSYSWTQLGTSALHSEASGSVEFGYRTVRSDGQFQYDGWHDYAFDTFGRVSRVSLSGALGADGYIEYVRDDRGNISKKTTRARSGSTKPDIVEKAQFPVDCVNRVVCNKPQWTQDANNNQTDYTYDPTTGQTLTVISPPDQAGTRRMTAYGYTWLQAFYKNASGQVVASGVPISKLTSISTCVAGSSCTGSSRETRTVLNFGPQVAGVPNNLQLVSATQASGDGSLSSTIAYTYDAVGNVTSVDGPLAGSDDAIFYHYDVVGRRVGVVGPDPDGTGPRPRTAMRWTYNDADQVALQELGTVASASDASWASFVSKQQTISVYNASGFKVSDTRKANGVIYGVSQYSYDSLGRLQCKASRMNSGGWNSLPASACSVQAAGVDGPDRISQTSYFSGPLVSQIQSGVGTPDVSTESYSYNGINRKPSTVTDPNGNVTSYSYDGFDRLSVTTYAGGSADKLGYDPNGNIISHILRDGQSLAYDYDALNRRIYDHNPKTNVAEVDVGYTYDLVGHLLTASDGNGWTKIFAYDALGRATQQGSNVSTSFLQYDTAGRMTRQTWADGFFITYEYDAAGEMTTVRENGGLALASFGYDDLGRRISLTRGNGTVSSYGYDAASRLTTLTQNLAGGSWDQTYGFGYNAANQITSRISSNDIYAWTRASNVDRNYGVNGLNQYTSAGNIAFGYDARGNLNNSGGTTYQYNSRNQLFMNGPGQLFYRNPAGELSQTPGTNYDWVNGQLAQESDNSVRRRYVYGPGADEVLVWYEGAGTSDRRYIHADERGSVIAVSNDAGNAVAINTYDEYGIPGAGNLGRFQYTGQIWQPELGLYDYKARMYSPTLGRFMQTDPIGYNDGTNWYNYAGSDPVNTLDPSGLTFTCNDGRILDDNSYVQSIKNSAQPCVTTPPPDIVVNGYALPKTSWMYFDYSNSYKEMLLNPFPEVGKPQMKPDALLKKPYGDPFHCVIAMGEGAVEAFSNPGQLIQDGLSAVGFATANAGRVAGAAFPAGRAINIARASLTGAVVGAVVIPSAAAAILKVYTDDRCYNG